MEPETTDAFPHNTQRLKTFRIAHGHKEFRARDRVA
jgi:hypothetical protein